MSRGRDARATPAGQLRVEFEPAGRRIDVEPGTTLLDAARQAGIGLATVCGGEGTCGRCRVVVMAGDLPGPSAVERRTLTRTAIAAGERLACRIPVITAMRVDVPRASLIAGQRLQLRGPDATTLVDPAVRALSVTATAPDLHDQRADLERLASAAVSHGVRRLRAEPAVIRQASALVRGTGWECVLLVRGDELIGVLPPGGRALGFAVDLGTTKVAGYLLDLETGETVAEDGRMNPQIAYGEDVVSRLAYAARRDDGSEELARVVRIALDELVGALCAAAGVPRAAVAEGVVVANTAMHHLLLGLPTRQLAAAPFVAAASAGMDVRAADLRIAIAPAGRVHVPPIVGGFVGADHVAMVLGAELDRVDAVKVGVDIGTNTEVVLRRPDRNGLACTSCASGPAFEGAHIRDGMRAGPGAIEAVVFPDGDGAPLLRTIDGAPPVGICGSGIVDAIAELNRTGRLDRRGRFRADAPGVRRGEQGLELVLADAATSGTGREIVISQQDVNEIQLAKGAIAASVTCLLESTGTPPEAVDEVVVAGAFGSYLDLESALAIGMLPRLPNAAYVQVGNAAGTGARATLLSLRERARARGIARDADYLELTTWPGFQATFARAMHLPPPRPAEAASVQPAPREPAHGTRPAVPSTAVPASTTAAKGT